MNFEEVYTILEKKDYPQQDASKLELLKWVKKRKQGAVKIHTQSSRRAGPSRLTASHFGAKIPVYNKIIKMIEHDEDLKKLKTDYLSILSQLRKSVRQATKFQKLTGELEVLGEVLIETRNM